jgi:hypothetical protein
MILRFSLFLLLFNLALPAQTTRTDIDFSGTKMTYSDLGTKGIIISAQSGREVNAALIDLSGKQLWKQTINYSKSFRYVCCASPDGNSFYVLMYWKSKAKGGTEGLTVSKINTSDGSITNKEYPDAAPGHALVVYATNTAFYVVTTPNEWSNHKSNEYTTSLLRFSSSDLSYTTTNAEMAIAYEKDKLLWQFYKVEQSYVEGYRVAAQNGQTLQLEIARFDTTGKKIFSKQTDLELKQGVAFPTNTELPRYNAIGYVVSTIQAEYMGSNGPVYPIVDLLSLAHIVYDVNTSSIYVFGAMGPTQWKNNNNKCTGYYFAKLDKDFNVVKISEHPTTSLISGSVMASGLHKDQRYYTGALMPDNKFFILAYAMKTQVLITLDANTLAEVSVTNYTREFYRFHNAFMPALDDALWNDPKVQPEVKHFGSLALFANRKVQIACAYKYDGSGGVVFTKVMR